MYSKFDVYIHGEKLYFQIFRNMTRVTAQEIAIKARVSKGLTVTDYIGSFMRYNSSDIALSSVDADKTISCLIRNDDKMAEGHTVFAQFAMLFTDMEGIRNIRVFNYSWKVAKNLYSYFKSSDCENLAQFKIRNQLSQTMRRGAKTIKEKLINDLVDMLYNYRT